MIAGQVKEANIPTWVDGQRTGTSGRNNVPDLSDDLQDSSVPTQARSAVYRGWAWLVCVENRLQGPPPSLVVAIQPLMKSHILIGNNAEVCDLVFNSGRISREHAELEFDVSSGTFFLSDRGSTNGTFVRPPSGSETRVLARQPLLDGSRLRLADDVVLVFRAHCQKVVRP